MSPLFAFAADAPFTITVDRQNTISASASGTGVLNTQSSNAAKLRAQGDETSECRPYGRQSSALAFADTEVLQSRSDGVSLRLASSVSAQGGHYRTCATCLSGNCVGLFGHDTSSQASATTQSTVAIRFNDNFAEANYELRLAATHKEAPANITLTGPDGVAVSLADKIGKPIPLRGSPGAIYFVSANLPVTTTDSGSCCESTKSGMSQLDITVLRAPILASHSKFMPFIKGGKQTNAYKAVGALVIDGDLHCTGSVIGSRTVLTAAHCLNGYENRINKMAFLLGSNLLQPIEGPISVQELVYPNDPKSGFFYNPATLEDDIGLVYLSREINVPPIELHAAEPTWDEIKSNRTNLIFVGFGYDVIEDQPIGVGIKREAAWFINGVENRRVTFKVEGRNTCKGDSGGPAFVQVGNRLVQAAVTSGGDDQCTEGFETRVDAFKGWLLGKVK